MWKKIRVVKEPVFGNPGDRTNDEVYYSVDGKTVMYQGYVVRGADFETFVCRLDFAKDKNKCYRATSAYKGADPETFEVLNQYLAKDRNFIYSLDGVVKNVDYETFDVLDCGYEMDSEGERHAVLSYGSDRSGIWWMEYYSHKPVLIKGTNRDTFQRIDGQFAKDHRHVYWRGRKVTKAEPSTFIPLNQNYGKDAANIFCQTVPLTGADYETFSVGDQVMLAWDKDRFYNLQRVISREEFDQFIKILRK